MSFIIEKKDNTIIFRVTKSQKDTLEYLCKKTNEKKTNLILRLLQEELEKLNKK